MHSSKGEAMIKLVFCLRRKPGMSREAFQSYWRERHAPLVRKYADTIRCKRYTQLHTTGPSSNAELRATRGAPEEYDGVAELWFDEGDFANPSVDMAKVREATAQLIADEREFIDLAQSPLFWTQEQPIIE
jgi:uncharacterized protein (TIGR02118 family)